MSRDESKKITKFGLCRGPDSCHSQPDPNHPMTSATYRFLPSVGLLFATALAAQALPNIVSVVERNGDTDRQAAKQTGITFDIENPTGTKLISGYRVGTFGEDAKSMTDRIHEYNATSATVPLPSYLVGKEYIMIANNNRDNANYQLDVTIAQHSLVYLLIDYRLGDGDNTNPPNFTANMKWVAEEFWVPISLNGNQAGNPAFPDTVGIDENADGSINNYSAVYMKVMPAGTFTLKQADNGGRNMYGVVVSAIPEPGVASLGLLGAGLLALRRPRR